MQVYSKKRVEVLIERALLRRMTDELESSGVSGFSVVPLAGGRGQSGAWLSEGQVGDAAGMFAIWCIVDESMLEQVLQAAFAVVSRQVGLVSVSDVRVVRPERF